MAVRHRRSPDALHGSGPVGRRGRAPSRGGPRFASSRPVRARRRRRSTGCRGTTAEGASRRPRRRRRSRSAAPASSLVRAVGKEEHEHADHARGQEEADLQSRIGTAPCATWIRSWRAAVRSEFWSAHFRERGFLGGAVRLRLLQRAKHRHAPGVEPCRPRCPPRCAATPGGRRHGVAARARVRVLPLRDRHELGGSRPAARRRALPFRRPVRECVAREGGWMRASRPGTSTMTPKTPAARSPSAK